MESVHEVKLSKPYRFMYENFLLATQQDVYIFLEKTDVVSALKFSRASFKYGGPNDEARKNHELYSKGLGFYGFFKVGNSNWALEYSKKCYLGDLKKYTLPVHYIVCFKDVMLEVLCCDFEELELTVEQINALMLTQLNYLD